MQSAIILCEDMVPGDRGGQQQVDLAREGWRGNASSAGMAEALENSSLAGTTPRTPRGHTERNNRTPRTLPGPDPQRTAGCGRGMERATRQWGAEGDDRDQEGAGVSHGRGRWGQRSAKGTKWGERGCAACGVMQKARGQPSGRRTDVRGSMVGAQQQEGEKFDQWGGLKHTPGARPNDKGPGECYAWHVRSGTTVGSGS